MNNSRLTNTTKAESIRTNLDRNFTESLDFELVVEDYVNKLVEEQIEQAIILVDLETKRTRDQQTRKLLENGKKFLL